METTDQKKPNDEKAGMIEGEENMTLAEYINACKKKAYHAFGMQEIPPEQWHDEWD